jgi:Methyltransferase domain
MRAETDPDPAWVAALGGATAQPTALALDAAAGEVALFRHLAREHAREGRSSYIEIDAPLELYAIARLLHPLHVVEVGVSSGVSSAYILSALRDNGAGTLHSIDLPSRPSAGQRGAERGRSSWTLPPDRDSGWAVPARLRHGWDLRLGDKAELIPMLREQLPRIDLVLYDVPHDCDDLAHEFSILDARLGSQSVNIVDHGPNGGLCPALRRWAHSRGSAPVRRAGLGLYGARANRSSRRPAPVRKISTARQSTD